jgi:hypothetical protein
MSEKKKKKKTLIKLIISSTINLKEDVTKT